MALTDKDLQAIQTLLLPMYGRLDGMESRLDRMDNRLNRMDSRLDRMESRLNRMDNRLNRMDSRLDRVDIRLDKLDSEVSSLRAGQLEIRKDIKNVDRKVSDTYNLALEAWGTSTENRVWLEGINPGQDGKGV